MSKSLLVFAAVAALLLPVHFSNADVYVGGYTRGDGTYVQGHHRSDPDGDPDNNWSHSGNRNPYTGERGRRH